MLWLSLTDLQICKMAQLAQKGSMILEKSNEQLLGERKSGQNLDKQSESQLVRQKKRLNRREVEEEEANEFLKRPVRKIEKLNKKLKKSYEKNHFLDPKFAHLKLLKQIRTGKRPDSISSPQNSDDQSFNLQDARPKRGNKAMSQSGSEGERKRSKPKKTITKAAKQNQATKKRGPKPKDPTSPSKPDSAKNQSKPKLPKKPRKPTVPKKQKKISETESQRYSVSLSQSVKQHMSRTQDNRNNLKPSKLQPSQKASSKSQSNSEEHGSSKSNSSGSSSESGSNSSSNSSSQQSSSKQESKQLPKQQSNQLPIQESNQEQQKQLNDAESVDRNDDQDDSLKEKMIKAIEDKSESEKEVKLKKFFKPAKKRNNEISAKNIEKSIIPPSKNIKTEKISSQPNKIEAQIDDFSIKQKQKNFTGKNKIQVVFEEVSKPIQKEIKQIKPTVISKQSPPKSIKKPFLSSQSLINLTIEARSLSKPLKIPKKQIQIQTEQFRQHQPQLILDSKVISETLMIRTIPRIVLRDAFTNPEAPSQNRIHRKVQAISDSSDCEYAHHSKSKRPSKYVKVNKRRYRRARLVYIDSDDGLSPEEEQESSPTDKVVTKIVKKNPIIKENIETKPQTKPSNKRVIGNQMKIKSGRSRLIK